MKLRCLFGFHKWLTHKRILESWNDNGDTYRVYSYCEECQRERQYRVTLK